ncbi:MAG: inositol monophosphatase, partial [Acidobacteria bacterium]
MRDDGNAQAWVRTAERAARAGWDALRPYWERTLALEVSAKGTHDFVTEADLASQRAIAAVVSAEHPDHLLLGEEGEQVRLDGERPVWIVDPLDGTTNFIHGNPVFGVSIGCWHDGRVVAGAVLDPLRGELFTARRGGGAFCNGRRLAVSSRDGLDDALIGTGFPFRRIERLEQYLGAFR